MKTIHRPFSFQRELRPVETDICSSKFLDCIAAGDTIYCCSQYYKNGEEGVLLVSRHGDCLETQVLATESHTALFPRLALVSDTVVCAWSEYIREENRWKITLWNGKTSLLDEPGSLILCDAIGIGNRLFLACARFLENNSDLCVLELEDGVILRRYDYAIPGIFSSRAVLACQDGKACVTWDGYCKANGYDIYFACLGEPAQKLTDGTHWCLRPDMTSDSEGNLSISYVRSVDVERDGVIGRAEGICVQKQTNGIFEELPSESPYGFQQDLFTGLLPDNRYFGYVGLRRNPRIVLDAQDTPYLFWEKQPSEEENWDAVENGTYFMKNLASGQTFLVQDGGNSYCMCKNSKEQIVFALRGETNANGNDLDICTYSFDAPRKEEIPYAASWDLWKSVDLTQAPAKTPGVLWGDFHCHSIHSGDAEGYADELYFYARDKAHLDFSGITDNDCYYATIFTYSESMYQELICQTISRDNEFLAFNGYEWTYYHDVDTSRWNHRSIIFYDTDRKIARRSDGSGESVEAFLKTMEDVDAGWHSHHAAWDLTARPQDCNVEITSSWHINMEICDHVVKTLDQGHRFGFMGSSDNHRYIPGNSGALTGILCDSFDRASMIDAIKQRRVYATTGNRAAICFTVNDVPQGSVAKGTPFSATFKVSSPSTPVTQVELIGDGGITLACWSGNGAMECAGSFVIPDTCHYAFLKVTLDGDVRKCPHNISPKENPLAWSSPVYLEKS